MYPDFQYVFQSLFNSDAPAFLAYIKTFGFFVAIAFLVAAWILTRELKRKEGLGLLSPTLLPIAKAKKFIKKGEVDNTANGVVRVYPHQRVSEIVFIALIGGLIGAKIFNALESWNEFVADPIGSLFSGSGLTFYGGLILATVLIYLYCRKHKIGVAHFCDAIAPALMLAYGIGRLGCHFSGDGDWGVFNSAYISAPNGSIKLASAGDFQQAVTNASTYFINNFKSVESVPSIHAVAPSGLPTWLFAMNFQHNVNNEGIMIDGCTGNYCHMLPVPVFPTSFYEAVICIFLFGVLWMSRKGFKVPLKLFGLYLTLNGLERFFIEKMKVNYKYDWGFLHPAQSEIISIILVVAGAAILLFYKPTQDLGEAKI